jgi:sporulation protein YlmC with PRC-barrel domain
MMVVKKLGLTVLAVALVVSGAGSALAADKDRPAWKPDTASVDSKHLIGMEIRTPDGKKAGEVDQLIVNRTDGKITHAVVGLGGVAGVGESKVVVPWRQLKLVHDSKKANDVFGTIDRAALDRAPRYVAIDRDRDRAPAASPATDRDRDGVPDRKDRAPDNPNKQ